MIQINIDQGAIFATLFTISITANIFLVIKFYFFKIDNSNRSKQDVNNEGDQSGFQLTGNNNVIALAKEYIPDVYKETVESVKGKSKSLEVKKAQSSAWNFKFDVPSSNKNPKTGFKDLDALLGVWDSGRLIALLGGPWSGKTTLALDIVRFNAVR